MPQVTAEPPARTPESDADRPFASISVFDAANFLLTLSVDGAGEREGVSHLKLQKLLYYAQGVCLAAHGVRLFDEEFQAWEHGPVCQRAYHRYKMHGGADIPWPTEFDPMTLPEQARDILTVVNEHFGQFTAWRLRTMTHAEPPWRDTYRAGHRELVISDDAMARYFKTILE